MKFSKKVVIFGPISNYGGREIEVNIIIKALQNQYDLSVLSTSYLDENSFVFQDILKLNWASLDQMIYSKYNLIKLFSVVSKFYNNGKNKLFAYVNNSLTKKIYDLDKLYLKEIENQLSNADCVILCMQLTSKFLRQMVAFCQQKNIPCLVRTTGTIKQIDCNDIDFLKKINLFIHHSEANAKNLNQQIKLPYQVIDQCAVEEQTLLSIINKEITPLRYGYLGRLSSEKGIIPLIDFFVNTDTTFLFAGDGPQQQEAIQKIKNAPNCTYLGLIKSKKIADFYEKIDVLIIPSFEESGPLVGLEAMAAGKIIISTDVGAMKERLIDLSAFWFDIEKPSSLKLVIDKIALLSEFEIKTIKQNNRKRYIEKYSLNTISNQYQQLVSLYINHN